MTLLRIPFGTSHLLVLCTLLLTSLCSASSQESDTRIISAGYGVTEIIYALQASDQLVAADFTSRSLIKTSDVAQVGIHVQLSSEGLMAQNPTHLIGTSEMGPKTTLDTLSRAGINVEFISSEQSMQGLVKRIEQIGQITGKNNQASELVKTVQKQVTSLNEQQCAQTPKALFMMLDRSGNYKVGGNNTAVDTIISLSGAQNPASELIDGYKTMNAETMITMQPDYILISQRAWDSLGSKDKVLSAIPLLKNSPAGKSKNIIVIPSGALLGGFNLSSLELASKLSSTFCN